jgi:inorganic pyrophosphatase
VHLLLTCVWCPPSRELPGELERIMTWFRDYKIPDGKPANAYGCDAKALDAAFAKNVVAETSAFYQRLRAGTKQVAQQQAGVEAC